MPYKLKALIFFGCLISSAVRAQGVDISDYEVYIGDFDNNGTNDYYFHSPVKIILLHGEILTPILLPSDVSFVVTAEKSHKPYFPPTYFPPIAYQLKNEQIIARGLKRSIESDSFHQSIIIGPIPLVNAQNPPGWDLVAPLVIVPEYSETGTFEISWSKVSGANKYKLYGGINRHIPDRDSTPPLLASTSKLSYKLIGKPSGQYTFYVSACINDDCGPISQRHKVTINIISEEQRALSSIVESWNEFRDAVLRGDVSEAKKYTTIEYGAKVEEAFDLLGSEVEEIFQQIEGLSPYYIDKEIAIFLILKENDQGVKFLHSVTFVANDESWLVQEL